MPNMPNDAESPGTCEICGAGIGPVLFAGVTHCAEHGSRVSRDPAVPADGDDTPTCETCGKTEDDGASIVNVPDGGNHGTGSALCDDCARADGWETCSHCGEMVEEDSYHFIGDIGEIRCDTCIESSDPSARAFRCEGCRGVRGRNEWHSGAGIEGPDGSRYCDRHAEDIYHCDTCHTALWSDDTYSGPGEDGGTYCESCHGDARQGEPVTFRPASAEKFPTVPEGYTFGVEIEAILPAYPNTWELVEDASVSGSGGMEAVSPIMRGTEGLRSVYGAVRATENGGAEPVDGGGVHFHCGAQGFTHRDLFRIFRAWETWGEDVFAGMVPGYRWGTRWCHPQHGTCGHSMAFADYVSENSGTLGWDDVADLDTVGALPAWGSYEDRYTSLNPRALGKHGTLECRIFPSSVDAETVATWGALFVRFVDVARRTEPVDARRLCDRYGTMRAGLRILAQGSDVLRTWAETVSVEMGRNIPARYSAAPSRDPWGKDAKRKIDRRATPSPRKRKADRAVVVGLSARA